jgi:hypothetical protein
MVQRFRCLNVHFSISPEEIPRNFQGLFLIERIKGAIPGFPSSASILIKAEPMIAPWACVVACVKVAALLIPKPTIWGFLRPIVWILSKYANCSGPNPSLAPVVLAELTM